jgi:hypothetical protein
VLARLLGKTPWYGRASATAGLEGAEITKILRKQRGRDGRLTEDDLPKDQSPKHLEQFDYGTSIR